MELQTTRSFLVKNNTNSIQERTVYDHAIIIYDKENNSIIKLNKHLEDTQVSTPFTKPKASFTLSWFSVPASLRCGPHWIGIHRVKPAFIGKWPTMNSKTLKQPGLTGTQRAAKQCRLIPGHHRSSCGINRISAVRPPGETVANRH